MVRTKKLMREITGTLKDKASLIKATMTTKRTLSSIKIAILKATTHCPAATPPEHRLKAILSLGLDGSPRFVACACVDSIMDRLHITQSPHVALKCLLVLHNILNRGSFLLKEQLSYYPTSGCRNSLNATRFRHKNGNSVENRELSQWVRWYASVLERNLISSKAIGCYLDCSGSVTKPFHELQNKRNYPDTVLKEIDALICMVEGICSAPESLHYQKMDSVHELMLLVSEDYRFTQYHIIERIRQFNSKIDESNVRDWSALVNCLKRLEGCRGRLVEMFANRKRNDAFWDLIGQTGRELEDRMGEERERGRSTTMVVGKKKGGGETTSQKTKLLTCRSQWLDADGVHFNVSPALA